MEWKSTNISKKELEKQQKEYIREAMDMMKRAKPDPQTVSSPAENAEIKAQNVSAEVENTADTTAVEAAAVVDSVKIAEEISVSAEITSAPAEEEKAQPVSAVKETETVEEEIQTLSAAGNDIVDTAADEETAQPVSAVSEDIEEAAANAENAAVQTSSAPENVSEPEDAPVSAISEDRSVNSDEPQQAQEVISAASESKAEEYDVDDFKELFKQPSGETPSESYSDKVPDFESCIKNHNAGCSSNSRDEQKDGGG